MKGIYGYSSGADSPYTRSITIDPLGNTNEIAIKVTVSWAATALDNAQKSFTVTENLFDWIQ